jgi:molybdenum cofactor synthesis domain-containing protein
MLRLKAKRGEVIIFFMKTKVTASLLIIGDEILSGRTHDQNLNFLANGLEEIGINLCEVRVVADIESEIIQAANELRKKFDYVFTSGGIGPTHDDITSESIAKAFCDKLIKNSEAMAVLNSHYGVENVNEARAKMAMIPSMASLLANPVSSAPGFRIENVFVMAGIPRIFQAMFAAAKTELIGGKKTSSREIQISLTESVIAKDFSDLQKKYSEVSMGSYPFDSGTSLVFRSTNIKLLEEAITEMLKKIEPNFIIKIS